MTFIDTIEGMRNATKPKEKQQDAVRVDWLILEDGQSVTVQPLQEMDPNSPAYNDELGRAFLTYYHQSPYDWKRQALCTKDDGQCLPCELNNVDVDEQGKPRTWYARKRFGISLIVDEVDKESGEINKVVKGFHCSTSGNGILNDLLDFYAENGPITEQQFTLTRKGAGTDTSYSLVPKIKNNNPVDVSEFEPQPVRDGIYLSIPYERQANYYKYAPAQHKAAAAASSTAPAIEW